MSLSSFQRRRRELAQKAANENKKEEPKVSGSSDNKGKRKSNPTNKHKQS
jgi:hypothetical protein